MTTPTQVRYLPKDPVSYHPAIGLIGAGGISKMHLAAYNRAGYEVVMICDIDLERAVSRRDEFFPRAAVTGDYRELLANTDIEVVDIATHVDVRPALVREALLAGKHVLSQKPFVRDLEQGDELVKLARTADRRLAVNQNGRWAPHFAYLLSAVRDGLVGEVGSADFSVYWAHDVSVKDSPVFSAMEDLILYDFGIHWFDIVAQLFSDRGQATSVSASIGRTEDQLIPVPTLAQVTIDFEGAQATLTFRGASHFEESGAYRVDGRLGSIIHTGTALGGETVRVATSDQDVEVALQGDWWENGMHGTMGELLSAIEDGRVPTNAAEFSLPGLALCFAAVESSRSGLPVDPRDIAGI